MYILIYVIFSPDYNNNNDDNNGFNKINIKNTGFKLIVWLLKKVPLIEQIGNLLCEVEIFFFFPFLILSGNIKL